MSIKYMRLTFEAWVVSLEIRHLPSVELTKEQITAGAKHAKQRKARASK